VFEETYGRFQWIWKMVNTKTVKWFCALKLNGQVQISSMRDQLLSRSSCATITKRGDKWCVYPMYDFLTHCFSMPLKKWRRPVCNAWVSRSSSIVRVGWFGYVERRLIPQQIEFARLILTTRKRASVQLKSAGGMKKHRTLVGNDPRMRRFLVCVVVVNITALSNP